MEEGVDGVVGDHACSGRMRVVVAVATVLVMDATSNTWATVMG